MSLFSELRGVILSVGQDFRSVYVIVVSVEGSTEYYLVGVDCLHVENCILCIYLYSNRLNNTTCFCTLYKSVVYCTTVFQTLHTTLQGCVMTRTPRLIDQTKK